MRKPLPRQFGVFVGRSFRAVGLHGFSMQMEKLSILCRTLSVSCLCPGCEIQGITMCLGFRQDLLSESSILLGVV